MRRSRDRTPWHWYHDAALHGLNEWHSLVNCLAPSWYAPALLSPGAALLEVGELPQVVDFVESSYLNEPCCGNVSTRELASHVEPHTSHSLHDFSSSSQTLLPVRLPFQEVARVQSVGSKLKDATQLSRRRSWPEAEFLHE